MFVSRLVKGRTVGKKKERPKGRSLRLIGSECEGRLHKTTELVLTIHLILPVGVDNPEHSGCDLDIV